MIYYIFMDLFAGADLSFYILVFGVILAHFAVKTLRHKIKQSKWRTFGMNNNFICEEIMTLKQVKRKRNNKDIPEKIVSSFDLAHWMSKVIGTECREHLIVVCLNTKNQINCYSTVSVGSLNQSIAHPRDVMQRALLSNAARIAILHNHPSGNPLTIV